MARFVGKGSVGAKRDLYPCNNEAGFEFYGNLILLRFVDACKHMGTNFSLTHDLSQEVSTRVAVIRSSTHAIKNVLRNPNFPLKRTFLCQGTPFFERFFFQCSTWGPLPPALYGKIHSSVIQVYRGATKKCLTLPLLLSCPLMLILT